MNTNLRAIKDQMYDALDRGVMDTHTYNFVLAHAQAMCAELDKAYRERARLVASLARNTMLADHVAVYYNGDPDWPVVFINGPTGQMSWHIHKDDVHLFSGCPEAETNPWDGHTTEEKYDRLSRMGL